MTQRSGPQRADARRVIGVLTPLVGGFYSGALIAGIARVAAHGGHRVVAIQTVAPRLDREQQAAVPLDGGPPALGAVDGVVVVVHSVEDARLLPEHARGLPIVLVGADRPGFDAPIVLPDNAAGAHAAVDHLVSHGHERIGFVGDLAMRDIRERFEGYRAALARHGLAAMPDWFYPAAANREHGGMVAAEAFVAAGMPTTATVAATDENAIGFMQALRGADLALPRDQAVISFDHTERGARQVPRLSTINPHHDRAGELAATTLLAMLDGRDPGPVEQRLPVTLVVRESCGCSGVTAVGASGPGEDALVSITAEGGLGRGGIATATRLQQVAQTAFMGPASALSTHPRDAETRAAWVRALLEPLVAAADRGTATPPAALHRLHHLTAALRPYPEALEQCLEAVREVEHELSIRLPAGLGREAALHRAVTDVMLALARSCTRPLLGRGGALERTLADQYEVDIDMMSPDPAAPRNLHWLPRSVPGPACLALWADDDGGPSQPGGRVLEVVGVRGRSAAVQRLVGSRLAAEEFPPAPVVRSETVGASSLTIVVPVTSAQRDWGLLAINGRVEAQASDVRERYHHWAGQLAILLDHEEAVRTLREREAAGSEAVRAAARAEAEARLADERLELWTAATQAGTWDWDVARGTVAYSPQWCANLALDPAGVGAAPGEWFDRVHPDDAAELAALVAVRLGGDRSPLRTEHRLRDAAGEYRLMACRAVTVLDDAGAPSRIVGTHLPL